MKKYTLIFVPIFIFPMILASFCMAFQEEGTIRIGEINSVTGKWAAFGLQQKYATRMAIEEVNGAGGIMVGGKKVKIDIEPYSYDVAESATQALATLRKLDTGDKVLMIIGAMASAHTEVVFGQLQKKLGDKSDTGNTIPCFSCTSSLEGLSDISPWGFVNTFSERDQIFYELPILLKAYAPIKTAAVLYEADNAYAVKTWERGFKAALEENKIDIVEVQQVMMRDTELSTQIMKVRAKNPDMLVISGSDMAPARAMIEAKRQGWRPKLVLGGVGTFTPKFLEIGKEAVEGFIGGSSFYPGTPKAKPVVDKFYEASGKKLEMTMFGSSCYEIIYEIKWVIENSGIKNMPDTIMEDRVKFRDTVLKIHDFEGISGKISMKPNRNVLRQGVLLQVKEGKFALWEPPKK